MMKRKWIALICVVVLALTGTVIAFANQENELDTPCDHHYQIVSLEPNGDIILKCDNCNDRFTTTFEEHINERNYQPLDVVPDGLVNAKDYAYIIQHYGSDTWGGEIVPPIF